MQGSPPGRDCRSRSCRICAFCFVSGPDLLNLRQRAEFGDSDYVLFQQVERCGEKNQILHEKATRSVIAGNPLADTAQPSGISGMIVDVAMKLPHAPKAPRTPNFLFQESREQERPKQPLRNAQEISGTANAENWVHPKNQGAVADIRNQRLRLILKPLLISEKEEDDYHRGAKQMIVKVLLENTQFT